MGQCIPWNVCWIYSRFIGVAHHQRVGQYPAAQHMFGYIRHTHVGQSLRGSSNWLEHPFQPQVSKENKMKEKHWQVCCVLKKTILKDVVYLNMKYEAALFSRKINRDSPPMARLVKQGTLTISTARQWQHQRLTCSISRLIFFEEWVFIQFIYIGIVCYEEFHFIAM